MTSVLYLIIIYITFVLSCPCESSQTLDNKLYKSHNPNTKINTKINTKNPKINTKTNPKTNPKNLKNSTLNTQTNTQTNTNLKNFVKWDGRDFVLNGEKFVPVGFNAYWLGFTEEYSYPKHSQIEEMFKIAEQIGATVIRSHTLGFSGGSPNSLRPFDNNLNPNAWDSIDYSFYMANLYNIKLVIPLIDGYNYYHGSYGEFCKTRGLPKNEFWSNQVVRNDFKQYINEWLQHTNKYTGIAFKDDAAIGLIELGNELGNIRPNVGSTSIPTKDWIKDISSYIKSIDKNHLVLHGVDESLGQNDDFQIDSLDVYSGHFYGKDYSRIDFGSNSAANVKKAYIIGEYDCHFEEDWFTEIERRTNVKGTIFWNVYPHTNGYKSGLPVPHNDGYTIHYPENELEFDRIQQHFKNLKSR
jgi:mannan endo-1,4-beta-mannosidase